MKKITLIKNEEGIFKKRYKTKNRWIKNTIRILENQIYHTGRKIIVCMINPELKMVEVLENL